MGPKQPRSTVLTKAEEALIVTCRRHTLLPRDDGLYAWQSTVPPDPIGTPPVFAAAQHQPLASHRGR
jgi:hypothetical protein